MFSLRPQFRLNQVVALVALLLAVGLRALSMPAAAVGAVKRAIAAWPPAEER